MFPSQDTPNLWLPDNHYARALLAAKPGQRYSLPGFSDDQQYRYYAGLAKHAGKLPRPLAFRTVYDAFTEPLLYRYYSDDAQVPAGINRFDLHGIFVKDGKLEDYRSDKKGPAKRPRPIGSRMGPQNMICCGWAIQCLRADPDLWEARYQSQFADDLRVYVKDPVPAGAETNTSSDAPMSKTVELAGVKVSLLGTRSALHLSGECAANECTIRSSANQKGRELRSPQAGERQIDRGGE